MIKKIMISGILASIGTGALYSVSKPDTLAEMNKRPAESTVFSSVDQKTQELKKIPTRNFVGSTIYSAQHAFAEKNVIPVAVLGSGPAGYSAAMYTVRAGMPTFVFTGPLKGGQLMGTTAVENYPGIKKAMGSMIPAIMAEQAVEFGATIVEDTITEVDLSTWPFILRTERGTEVRALALIIATGATPKKLEIPQEEKYYGNGISSCALCDCLFFKGKDVVVVGGGDAAVEEALQLSPHVRSVTILVRKNEMRAARAMQEKLFGLSDYKNIKVVFNKVVMQVFGDGDVLTGIEIQDTNTRKKEKMDVDGLFLAIGQSPNVELFKDQLDFKPGGYIAIEPGSQKTSIDGVYAAGDVEDSVFRQAIIAAGRGSQAGLETVMWFRQIGITDGLLKKHADKLFVADSMDINS